MPCVLHLRSEKKFKIEPSNAWDLNILKNSYDPQGGI